MDFNSLGVRPGPDAVAAFLRSLREPLEDFYLEFTGKKSKAICGYYKPADKAIYLHEHENAVLLISTAMHEYAHHLVFTEYNHNSRAHSVLFWSVYHDLFDAAESKGYCIQQDKELDELVDRARKLSVKIAEMEAELGGVLNEIIRMSNAKGIDSKDVIHRQAGLTDKSVKACQHIHKYIEPGFNSEKIKIKIAAARRGEPLSADTLAYNTVYQLRAKNIVEKLEKTERVETPADDAEKLEKEAERLEHTIKKLTEELDDVRARILELKTARSADAPPDDDDGEREAA